MFSGNGSLHKALVIFPGQASAKRPWHSARLPVPVKQRAMRKPEDIQKAVGMSIDKQGPGGAQLPQQNGRQL